MTEHILVLYRPSNRFQTDLSNQKGILKNQQTSIIPLITYYIFGQTNFVFEQNLKIRRGKSPPLPSACIPPSLPFLFAFLSYLVSFDI